METNIFGTMKLNNMYVSSYGKEPGEPVKLAKALMRAVNDSNPPFRLLVGKGMVGLSNSFIMHVFTNTMLGVKFLTTPILNK
ncbi:hypothetical protein ACSU6B_21305 [Neobacillus sp. C211]|uniref:hypothetical protein n=1 Tax=unclassified Neobacillus TaxID=2675272 RepID=UPI0039785E8A